MLFPSLTCRQVPFRAHDRVRHDVGQGRLRRGQLGRPLHRQGVQEEQGRHLRDLVQAEERRKFRVHQEGLHTHGESDLCNFFLASLSTDDLTLIGQLLYASTLFYNGHV